MEKQGGGQQEKKSAQEIALDARITRGIINYFLMAENLSPDDFTDGNPGNPIRFIEQERPITQTQLKDFFYNLSHHKYDIYTRRFFKDLVGPQSPIALPAEQKAANLKIIKNNPDLSRIYEQYGSKDSINSYSIDPEIVATKVEKIMNNSPLQDKQSQEKLLGNITLFLKLYFGESAIRYSVQFASIKAQAEKIFGRPPRPWERPFSGTDSSGFDARRPDYGWHQNNWPPPPSPGSGYQSGRQSSWDRNPPPPPPKQEAKKPHTIDTGDPKGYYRVLGLDPAEMRTLSPEEYAYRLKKAYRAAALANHTDVGGSREAIVAVNLANDFLSDPLKRQRYGR